MCQVRRVRQRGFTLIELLIVVTIIAILVGLLLPAIARVRSASNTANASSNLRQILTAAHNHQGLNKFLPPITLTYNIAGFPVNFGFPGPINPGVSGDWPPAGGVGGVRQTFFSAIMPFAELDVVYNKFTPGAVLGNYNSNAYAATSKWPNGGWGHFNYSWSGGPSVSPDVSKAGPYAVKLYLNPLDPTGNVSGQFNGQSIAGFGVNSQLLPNVPSSPSGSVTTDQIIDGASNTVMLAEKYSGANGQVNPNYWWQITAAGNVGAAIGDPAQANAVAFQPLPGAVNTATMAMGGRANGILLGMADGSVKTLSQNSYNANPNTLWKFLLNPADGTQLPDW